MPEQSGTPDDVPHDVDAIPFHCAACNTDVKLKAPTGDPEVAAAIGCQCEIINILDFTMDDIPSKWARKGTVDLEG